MTIKHTVELMTEILGVIDAYGAVHLHYGEFGDGSQHWRLFPGVYQKRFRVVARQITACDGWTPDVEEVDAIETAIRNRI